MSTRNRTVKVVVQVVDMHISATEAPAWGNVEVANDFVNAQVAFDPTAFVALFVKALSISLPFTLLNTLSSAKSPTV